MNELQQKAILADFKKRALEVHPMQAVVLLMAEPKDGVVRSKILELAEAKFSPENFRYIQDMQDLKAAQPLSTDSAARAKLINDYIRDGAETPVNIGNAGRINEAAGYLMNLTEPSHNAVKALQFLRAQKVEYEPLPAADFYKPVDELDNASRNAAPNTTAIDLLEANSIGASPEPFQEMRDQLSRASQIVISQLQNSFIERYLGDGSSMAERISPQLKREILDLQEQDWDNGAPQPEVIKALGQKLASIPDDLMARAAASPDYPRHVSAALNQAIATMLEFTEGEVGSEFGKNAMQPPIASNKASLLTF